MGSCCSKGEQGNKNEILGKTVEANSNDPSITPKGASKKPDIKPKGSSYAENNPENDSNKNSKDKEIQKPVKENKRSDKSPNSENKHSSRYNPPMKTKEKQFDLNASVRSEYDSFEWKVKEERRLEKEKRKEKLIRGKSNEKMPKATPTFVNEDDRPISQAKGVNTRGWWEVDEPQDTTEQVGTGDVSKTHENSDGDKDVNVQIQNLSITLKDSFSIDLEDDVSASRSIEIDDSMEIPAPRTVRPIVNQIPNKKVDIEDSTDRDKIISTPTSVPIRTTDDTLQENTTQATTAKSVTPKFKRPLPLKRGVRPLGPKRPGPAKPTIATVTTLLKKIKDLGEDRFNEQLKSQSELNGMLQKYPEVVKECDSLVLIDAAKSIIVHASSGRSNVSKNSIICIGNLFSVVGNVLVPVLADIITVCIKKGISGSPEFLSSAANSTLIKVCNTGAEGRVSSAFLSMIRQNKSYQLIVLNSFVILLNRLGDSIIKLKTLPDIIDAAAYGLNAGNLSIRKSSKIIFGIINKHSNLDELLNRSGLSMSLKMTVKQSIKRYNSAEKDELIQELSKDVV
ncbi:hypothetical protein BEWA_001490 [Theileria equi strain WA]|uniref:CLASP N-terminal domain-containing protein n=1 Tax=Theileria equi strain WA TaxID=1537102 RepID=L0AYS0_THEEQ|nr:hypothetical protein BEWA_001490 [Theileria equi strain WA]AFZ80742.1 hypothetical protein BEWA_001490 [Theileria equi strain WA]|eukprot:XP_004830408.1 hypothetical protein BEWA_001490 [Theileria equi strain WA]